MKIDPGKLQNVQYKPDGSFVARCPACSERGADNKGEHLIVYPNGEFGCVANTGDKAHNKAIMRAAGNYSNGGQIKLPVNRLRIPESRTIQILGRVGLVNQGSLEFGEEKAEKLTPPVNRCGIIQPPAAPLESPVPEETLSDGKRDGWSTFSPTDPTGYGKGSLEGGVADEEIIEFLRS